MSQVRVLLEPEAARQAAANPEEVGIAEMRDAGVDWQMNLYGNTVHSFTNPTASNAHMPDAVRYNAAADKRSWASMQGLFAERLV